MIAWLTARLVGPVAVYAVIGLAATCALLWGWAVIQGYRLDAAKGAAAEAKANLEAAASANGTNIETIKKIGQDLAQCISDQKNLDQAAADMEAARRQMILRQERAIADLKRQLESRYAADPQCAAFDRMPVCRPVNDRLRTLAGPDGDG